MLMMMDVKQDRSNKERRALHGDSRRASPQFTKEFKLHLKQWKREWAKMTAEEKASYKPPKCRSKSRSRSRPASKRYCCSCRLHQAEGRRRIFGRGAHRSFFGLYYTTILYYTTQICIAPSRQANQKR